MRARRQHGDDDVRVPDRLGDRSDGRAAGRGGAVEGVLRQVEGGHGMTGLRLIGRHAPAHVAEADEGDPVGHGVRSLLIFGRVSRSPARSPAVPGSFSIRPAS